MEAQDNGTEKYTGTPDWNLIAYGDGGITRIDPTDNLIVYQEILQTSVLTSPQTAAARFTSITSGMVANAAKFYAPYALDASGDIYTAQTI